MIEIKMPKKSLSGYTFIEGFPGAGLVGPMAINYIIEKMKMENIGYISSEKFPPLVSIHEDVPMQPVRIYISEKLKIITVFAEFAIPIELTYELGSTIYSDIIKKTGISRVISISGIPTQQEEPPKQVFGVASSKKLVKDVIEKNGLKPIGDGMATGINALILGWAMADSIDDINILVPINPALIDPEYAVLAIKSLNSILGIDVDTAELDKEAKVVEAKIRELMKKARETHENFKKTASDDTGPSMYA
ncbi:MAG: PAC2 family protein [Candidatus Micrarchaeaceae archaeon]